MEKNTSCKQVEDQELVVLLRSLRVEAAPEAHFEERFLYDFRERLVQEAVSRPARALLWEHLVHYLRNFGRRRWLWGASSFSLGVLCLGALAWLQGSGAPRMATRSYKDKVQMSPSDFLAEVSPENIGRTTLHRRKPDRPYAASLSDSLSIESVPFVLENMDDQMDLMQPSPLPASASDWEADIFAAPELMLHSGLVQ